MSDRWTGFGLLVAAVLCCAGPVLISTGLAGVAWGLARQHWGWIAGSAGLIVLAVLLRQRRAGAA